MKSAADAQSILKVQANSGDVSQYTRSGFLSPPKTWLDQQSIISTLTCKLPLVIPALGSIIILPS